jgi:hypothetical protein
MAAVNGAVTAYLGNSTNPGVWITVRTPGSKEDREMPEEKPFEEWALIMLPNNRIAFGLVSDVEIASERYLRVHNPEPSPDLATTEFFVTEQVSRIKVIDRETVSILARVNRQMPVSDSEREVWATTLREFTL